MKTKKLPLILTLLLLPISSCSAGENSSSGTNPTTTADTSTTTSSSTSSKGEQYVQQFVIHFNSNGGSQIADIVYIKGDNISLPTPKKYGYTFAGWYYDNDTFLSRCNSVLEISDEVTLYAKWVIKSVKIYLDTFYKDEFEPIIKEVGETFHISELPLSPRSKKVERIEYRFTEWKDAGENVPQDFVVKDQYYAFHANYGAPLMDDKYTMYENDFSSDYGFIDKDNSWSKIRDWPIKDADTSTTYLNPSISHYRETKVSDGALFIQSNQSGLHYVNNGVYLPTIAYPTNEYSVEVMVKFDAVLTSGDAKSGTFDSGFGIAVRQNDESKAYVATMLDPNSKLVRVASRDNDVNGSGEDVNENFSYALPSTYVSNTYHSLKAVVIGTGNATTLKAYFDNELAFTYSDIAASKDWFTSHAIGKKIALFTGGCSVSIDSIIVKNADESQILYQNDFSNSDTQSLFGDGWKQTPGSKGSANGEYNISNGTLNINDAYPMTEYQNQILHTPVNNFSDGVISFDFTFTELSGYQWSDIANTPDTKYFSLAFRAGSENLGDFGCVSFRQNGRVQAYKHQGETASSWSGGALFSFQANSEANLFVLNQTYSVSLVVEGRTISLFINDQLINSYKYNGTTMCTYDIGNVAILASSISVSIDNLRISRLAEE